MDTSQLDPESRAQMRLIAVETGLQNIEARLKAQEGNFGQIAQLEKYIAELDLRIKVLEEARQRQIVFNTEVSNRLTRLEKSTVEVKKPFSWWK